MSCLKCRHIEVCIYQNKFKFKGSSTVKIRKESFNSNAYKSCGHYESTKVTK